MEEKKNEQRELGRDEVYAEVQEVINNVEKARMVAEGGAKNGLKRNPYQTLKERGLMNPDFILSEFDKIQAKASTLSSGERDVISKIMMMALHNAAVKEYEKLNKSEDPEPEKPQDDGGIPKKKRTAKKAAEKK